VSFNKILLTTKQKPRVEKNKSKRRRREEKDNKINKEIGISKTAFPYPLNCNSL